MVRRAESPAKARFIEPMLLLRTDSLPEGGKWRYEIKLDGFRAIAFKTGGRVHIRSRNDKDFNGKYPAIVEALSALPDETVLDGEVVALDESGRPSFNALQNYGSSTTPLLYYVFDLLIVAGQDVTSASLADRRELLQTKVLPTLDEPIRESPFFDASLPDLIRSVKAQGLEGSVSVVCSGCEKHATTFIRWRCKLIHYRKAGPETVHTFLGATLFDEQDTAAVQIIDQCEVTMAAREGFLIHAQMNHWLGLTPLQTTFHGPLLNGVNFIPAQAKLVRHGLLAGHSEPMDGQSFKHRREAARWLRPGKLHRTRTVFRTVAPWRLGVQNRSILAGVQMTPAALRLVIVKRARLTAFPTGPLQPLLMPQVHMHFPIGQFQLDAFHAPRFSNTQNLGVQISILHLPII